MSTTSVRRARRRGRSGSALLLAMTVAFSGLTLAHVSSARALTPGPADHIGHWDATFEPGYCSTGANCDPAAAAVAAMPDGRIFYFNGSEADGDLRTGGEAAGHRTGARVLDLRSGLPQWKTPSSQGDGPPSVLNQSGTDFFCADLVQLPDGRVLVAGGSTAGGVPFPTTRILDPADGSVRPAGQMKHQRWYPGLAVMADGKVLMAGGVGRGTGSGGRVDGTETYDPAANTWTENPTNTVPADGLPPEPRLFLTPNGKVFYPGAGQSVGPGAEATAALWGLQRFFDPATGQWEVTGPSPWGFRDTATSVMLPLHPPYDKARILTFGGLMGPAPAGGMGVPLSTLTTVDRSGQVTNAVTGNTNFPRWFSSALSLPDGTVLAVGGAGNAPPATEAELPLREAELFIPTARPARGPEAPGRWYRMASPQRARAYHSSAVLLPDGRVLFGGGEGDSSFEIFSPPYLYRGARPVIRQAPGAVGWGETFNVKVGRALTVDSVVLMRLGSPQHVNDNDARSIRLDFTRQNGETLRVNAPPDGSVAPPGFYYLFVNGETAKGIVPSVARIVRVGPPAT